MGETPYPKQTRHLAETRRALAPEAEAAFHAFGEAVFREGAVSRKTKQLIAVAVAHTTQCPYCIQGHTKAATRAGATPEEIMEAIWVAAEMRAGGAFAHAAIALDTLGLLEEEQPKPSGAGTAG
ncbi:MAG TPA: carboxymuconolactone decarboxylase family protein [Kiloniellaceae bacterium]